MRLKEILKEHTYELTLDWKTDLFAIRNRFTNEIVADGYGEQEEAEQDMAELEAKARQAEVDYYKKGGKTQIPGDVHLWDLRDKS